MPNPKDDSLLGKLFVYAVIVLVCAGLAGGAGALWYVFFPDAAGSSTRLGGRYRRGIATEAMMKDTEQSMAFRFWVGAGIGGLIGGGLCVALYHRTKGA